MLDAIHELAEIQRVEPQTILNKVANECLRLAAAEKAITVTVEIPNIGKPVTVSVTAFHLWLAAKELITERHHKLVAKLKKGGK